MIEEAVRESGDDGRMERPGATVAVQERGLGVEATATSEGEILALWPEGC